MGWYSHYLWDRKDDVIRHLDEDFTNNVKLVRSSTVGNNHWQLIEITDGDLKSERFINLNMLSKSPNGSWGYKPIDETMGPVEVNCPVTILNQATETSNETAKKWRKAAYAHHEETKQIRAIRKDLQPGDAIEYGGKAYRLSENLGRKGWLVNGNLRMSGRQVNDAIRDYINGRWQDRSYLRFELTKEAREIYDNLQVGDTFESLNRGICILVEKIEDEGAGRRLSGWEAVDSNNEKRVLGKNTIIAALCHDLLQEHDEQERNQAQSRPSM